MKYAALAMLWIGLGLVGAGFDNAYFQRNPRWTGLCHGRQDLGKALVGTIAGPISLFAIFGFTGFGEYGWSLSPNANPKCPGAA